jgi:hypothetical protein
MRPVRMAVLTGGLGIDTAYARDGGFPYERFGGSMGGLSALTRRGEMDGTHMSFGRSDFGHRDAFSGSFQAALTPAFQRPANDGMAQRGISPLSQLNFERVVSLARVEWVASKRITQIGFPRLLLT